MNRELEAIATVSPFAVVTYSGNVDARPVDKHKSETIIPPEFLNIQTQLKSIDPNLLLIGCVLFCFALVYLLMGNKKNKIGRSRMATAAEVRRSRREALKDINNLHEMSLWLGMPDKFSIGPNGQIKMRPNRHTVVLRKSNEHIMFYGTTGAGKTRYGLNRLGFSAVQLELPIIAVDLKGDEERSKIAPTSEVAGFALENEYEIFTIAPFFEDSHCLNIVQLLKKADDLATANQLGCAIVENGLADGEKPNNWDISGGQLLAAGLMMSRGQPKGKGDDLVLTQKILARLASDPKSIKTAKIGQYQKAAYDEFLSTADSPETAASVAFSALRMMSRIMIPEITAVFGRNTNIPIVLGKKQMLIFRVDPEYATVILPLVAAAVELILQRNIYSGNPFGGLALLDELPQYRLPQLAKMAAVARSKKWCFAYGAQGESILEMSYGEARSKALLENCQTVSIMRLSSIETAKKYSEAIGREDATTKNKSSGKGGSSITIQESQRDVVPLEELLQQPTGRCILYTPTIEAKMDGGIEGEKRVRIPYRHQFKIPRKELRAMVRAEQNWRKYRPLAIEKSRAKPFTEDDLYGRELLAEHLLPSSESSKDTKIDFMEGIRDLYSAKSF
jgi:type IV secretory pathway TraG/TraD family ATPase VirD4